MTISISRSRELKAKRYSEKDESLLKKVTNQGAIDALGAIQGLVSYHNVNANKVSRETLSF